MSEINDRNKTETAPVRTEGVSQLELVKSIKSLVYRKLCREWNIAGLKEFSEIYSNSIIDAFRRNDSSELEKLFSVLNFISDSSERTTEALCSVEQSLDWLEKDMCNIEDSVENIVFTLCSKF